jgi:TubC N-terminal docking domain
MSGSLLLEALRAHGVSVTAVADRLRVEAPRGVLTPEVREQLALHKAELLSLLATARPEPSAPPRGVCRRCGQLAAPNLLNSCEPCADELHADRQPLKETDPEGYQRAVAWLEQQRDEKAVWLTEAAQVLAGLAPDDPRRASGEQKWRDGLAAYEALCRALPEPEDTTCLAG